MDIREFRKDLIEEVKAAAADSKNFAVSSFTDIATKLLSDAGEISDFELCHYRGFGTKRRSLALDGFSFDEADGSLRLVLSEWDGRESAATLTQTEAKAALAKTRAFVEESIEAKFYSTLENSSEAFSFSKKLHSERGDLTRIRIYLVTDRTLSGRARDFPEGKLGSIPVEYHIWDVARFHRVSESSTGRDDIEIDFSTRIAGGIPCIAASVESGGYKAYLCVIRGDVLATIYDEFGSRLLEGNVRSFLSAKGKINKGIRGTIRGEPQMFFAYNNGIAATASEAFIKTGADGQRLVRVKELQIVNGGQTTASLAAALREGGAALDTIFVQMKLSVVPSEGAAAIIPLIARYANSQNKVSDADFFSNHAYHRRLEMLSRRIWAPAVDGAQHETHWFYERARGQFVNEQVRMTAAEKKRFLLLNPKRQIISKTEVAKLENIWALRPHIVCLGAQKNFLNFAVQAEEQWDKADAKFDEDYFKKIISKRILFSEAERIVATQPWYQGGYRAQVVAYTLAKLVHLIGAQVPGGALDLRAVWTRQAPGEGIKHAIAEISGRVHDVLVNPDLGHANVTEWSKREQCWKRVMTLNTDVLALLRRELAHTPPETAVSSRIEEHRAGAPLENQILDLVSCGPAFWASLKRWGVARELWSEAELRLLDLASLKTFVPVNRQALKLLAIRERAASEGFVSS